MGSDRSIKNTVRDLVEIAWQANQRYHYEQGRGNNDCVRVLGNVKTLSLAVAHTILAEAFCVRPPNDFTCGTLWAVVFQEDNRSPHVPRLKWAEAKSNPLVKKWFTL